MKDHEAILFEELDEATAAEFEQMFSDMQSDEEEDRFRIDNDNLADWAVRKIQEERAENQRLHDIAQDQMDRINEKIAAADRRLESRTAFLMHRLSEYFGTVKPKETKTQAKYQLLSGTLVYTKPKYKIEKSDDATLVQWLKESGNTEFVKTVETPAWGDFKKRCTIAGAAVVDTDTGAIVEGARVVPVEGTFDVK